MRLLRIAGVLTASVFYLSATTLNSNTIHAQEESAAKKILSNQIQKYNKERALISYDTYILGPGDTLKIEVLDLPELSATTTIGPDGTIYLPRLRALYVEGLTIPELNKFIVEQLSKNVLEPEVFITPRGYRPVRVYIGGEVSRPGYYTLSSLSSVKDVESIEPIGSITKNNAVVIPEHTINNPTLFDALQAAKGVTPFSQLNMIQVIRKRPQSQGGGKIRTQVDFLRMISSGDEDVNIRLYDGDAIFVRRSDVVLRDQLLAASRTNLSPDFISVFVSGRVKEPGQQRLPQGASLNQAIASAGGPKLLRGKIEFLRFTQEGATDRRTFGYQPNAISGDYRNPVLMPGDVVRVNESIASASLELLNEITAPAVGLYSVYSIYRDIQQ